VPAHETAALAARKFHTAESQGDKLPRRAPVTIVSHTNVPHSASVAHAFSMIRAALVALGGFGCGFGARGLAIMSSGLTPIQPHRTADLKAPFRTT